MPAALSACTMTRLSARALWLGAMLIALAHLAGCATPAAEKPGALRADVLTRLGAPQAAIPLPAGGERFLYSELPAGVVAYSLDFDATGRLVRNEQVLTSGRFEQIPLGSWTTADVLRTFGRPVRLERVARFDGDIWTYRFLQMSDPRLAHVHVDPQGVVRLVTFTDEILLFDNMRD